MARRELYGTASCPHCGELREWLELRRVEFVEYDIEADPAARRRLAAVAAGARMVPVLVEEGKVVQIGWQGRGCVIGD